MSPLSPPYGGVSLKPAMDAGMAIEVVRVAWNLKQEAKDAARMGWTGPSVAELCGAWLAGRITATEAMEAIALHPAVLPELVRY